MNVNAKGDLIARAIALGLGTPSFEVTTQGPPHEPTFRVTVRVGGEVLGPGGEGRSKKDAERTAAEAALQALDGGTPATEGRWPIYSAVLAEALEVAADFAPDDTSLDEVRVRAAQLYRDLLRELGHGPEGDDEA
ncbi:putative dsRNA-binding protein [Deinococcus multiflagellatus]|uniref:DsRNA-binding protein n=1 Tax=Deinococcus multiflagellatus TaxID=1656887 RepID=A0ABW1ZKD4_9DEIO|nr:putative dsRNA-binding protein [Deinococcus multiflagellatus]MBZ9713294.1 RNA-binding protein [Deinococcus multiflagellatus]